MERRIAQEELDAATNFGPFHSVYLLPDKKTVFKTAREAEANTMKFVRERTNIPVPEVYSIYRQGDEEPGEVRIVMEYVQGDRLDHVWDRYTDEEKDSVLGQLRGYFAELREIKGTFIGSVDGSACDDQYFYKDIGGYGPYKNEAEFNQGLVRAWSWGREDDAYTQILCKMVVEVMHGHEFVMTHNDLDPRNILVKGSQVVALLDWEYSGFYPEYWEYCKALWRPSWDGCWVKDRGVTLQVLKVRYHSNSIV